MPSTPTKTDRLIQESAATFLYRLIIFALTFLQAIIVARALAPDSKGAYNLAMALPRLMVRLGNLGIGDAAIYQIGKDSHLLKRIAGTAITMSLAIGISLISIALVLQRPLSLSFLKGVNSTLFYIAIATIPLALLTDFAQDLLRGARDINGYNLSRLSHSFFLFVATSIVLVFLGLDALGAMLAAAITIAIELVLVLVLLRRHTPLALDVDKSLISTMTGFGLKAWVMQVMMYLNYDFDIFIVNYFATDTSSVGFYSLAAGLAETLWYFPNAVTVVLFPNIAADLKRGGELTPKACRHVLFLTFCSALGLGLVSPLLPLLYSVRYAPMVPPLLLLLPGVVMLSVFKVLSTGLFGRGQPMLASWAALLGLLLQLGLDVVLIPPFGINGAALASTLAYTFISVLCIIFYVRVTGETVRETLLLQRDDWQAYKKLIALSVGWLSQRQTGAQK